MKRAILAVLMYAFSLPNIPLWAEAPYLDVYDPDNIQGGCTMFCETPKPSSAEPAAAVANSIFDGASSAAGTVVIAPIGSGTNRVKQRAVTSSVTEDKRKALQVARQERNNNVAASASWAPVGLGLGADCSGRLACGGRF